MSARPITRSMTATAFTIEGYRATRTLGVVRGVTVRSRSIFETIGATAVIGVQYDATEVMQGVTEVHCYGTAIVAERA